MSTSISVYTTIDLLINEYRRSISSVKEVSDQSLTFRVPLRPAAPGITGRVMDLKQLGVWRPVQQEVANQSSNHYQSACS